MTHARSLDHVGIVVDDLEAATEFFLDLGLEREGATSVQGEWVGKIIGLEDVQADVVHDHEDVYRLCYIRGPEGIIVELAERIGSASAR